MGDDLLGVVRDGQIYFGQPIEWPEGTFVRVVREPQTPVDLTQDEYGIRNEDRSPEAIKRWIEEFDALEPPTMSDGELAEWERWRKAQRERDVERSKRIMSYLEGRTE